MSHDYDDFILTLARLQREALQRIRARMASQQEGLDYPMPVIVPDGMHSIRRKQ